MNTLFSQLSWTHFILIAAGLLLVYYLFVFVIPILIYFRSRFPGNSRTEQVVAALSSLHDTAPSKDTVTATVPDLIGKTRLPDGVSIIDSRDIAVEAEIDEPEDSFTPGLRDDLNLIFSQLKAEGGGKEDFFHKLAGLREFYHGISSHPAIREINSWLVKTAPFELTEPELQRLWA